MDFRRLKPCESLFFQTSMGTELPSMLCWLTLPHRGEWMPIGYLVTWLHSGRNRYERFRSFPPFRMLASFAATPIATFAMVIDIPRVSRKRRAILICLKRSSRLPIHLPGRRG